MRSLARPLITAVMLLGLFPALPTAAAFRGIPSSQSELFKKSDLDFLAELAADVVQASRVRPGLNVGPSPTNTCGFTLIMPGGRGSYPAFWIRDFSMSLDSGFITADEMLQHLCLAARCQNGPTNRYLKNGLMVPAFAIPDHINFDGTAAFYPGSYSSGEDQGNGTYGIEPPLDDNYEFIHIAYALFRSTGKSDFLKQTVGGLAVFDRLEAAFHVPTLNPVTGMVFTDDAQRAVGFGFCDAIYLTGDLLFPSLLRYRAAGELAEMCRAAGHPEHARSYLQIQKQIRSNLAGTFQDPSRIGGWLLGATKVGRQPDVWGTLYAVHLGVLSHKNTRRATESVMGAVKEGTILFETAVRHVPTNFNASASSAWERTAGVPINRYQNGAYWHTPTGWLLSVVRRTDPALASELFSQYIQHLRSQDFRRVNGNAPWECFGPDGYGQNGVYMTSVTLPWSVLAPKSSAP